MTILINGERRDLPTDSTVADLLAAMPIAIRHIAVEVNQEIVPRAKHATHQLREADRVEIVTLVGGG